MRLSGSRKLPRLMRRRPDQRSREGADFSPAQRCRRDDRCAGATNLFGRHVTDRAQHHARLCDPRHRRCSPEPGSGSPVWCASPKSRILTLASVAMKTFSGFKSRCAMCLSCAAARPRVICAADLNRLAQRQRTRVQTRPKRLTLQQLHDGIGHPVAGAEFVQRDDVRVREHRDQRCASRSKRERAVASAATVGGTILTATSRPTRLSWRDRPRPCLQRLRGGLQSDRDRAWCLKGAASCRGDCNGLRR